MEANKNNKGEWRTDEKIEKKQDDKCTPNSSNNHIKYKWSKYK